MNMSQLKRPQGVQGKEDLLVHLDARGGSFDLVLFQVRVLPCPHAEEVATWFLGELCTVVRGRGEIFVVDEEHVCLLLADDGGRAGPEIAAYVRDALQASDNPRAFWLRLSVATSRVEPGARSGREAAAHAVLKLRSQPRRRDLRVTPAHGIEMPSAETELELVSDYEQLYG
jgi:hypothetical protein